MNNLGPDTAWNYMASRLYSKINRLQWRVLNFFICGFGLGAILATIIWFAIWQAVGEPDMINIIPD